MSKVRIAKTIGWAILITYWIGLIVSASVWWLTFRESFEIYLDWVVIAAKAVFVTHFVALGLSIQNYRETGRRRAFFYLVAYLVLSFLAAYAWALGIGIGTCGFESGCRGNYSL